MITIFVCILNAFKYYVKLAHWDQLSKVIKQPTFVFQLWFHFITQAKIEICLRGIYILACLTVRDDIWYMDMK